MFGGCSQTLSDAVAAVSSAGQCQTTLASVLYVGNGATPTSNVDLAGQLCALSLANFVTEAACSAAFTVGCPPSTKIIIVRSRSKRQQRGRRRHTDSAPFPLVRVLRPFSVRRWVSRPTPPTSPN